MVKNKEGRKRGLHGKKGTKNEVSVVWKPTKNEVCMVGKRGLHGWKGRKTRFAWSTSCQNE